MPHFVVVPHEPQCVASSWMKDHLLCLLHHSLSVCTINDRPPSVEEKWGVKVILHLGFMFSLAGTKRQNNIHFYIYTQISLDEASNVLHQLWFSNSIIYTKSRYEILLTFKLNYCWLSQRRGYRKFVRRRSAPPPKKFQENPGDQ